MNGVKWKGRTIPKLPILQPEKVTTLPLEIRLTEEYALRARRGDDGRRPAGVRDRLSPARGGHRQADLPRHAWIDKQTFALLRRESIQLNLKGDTLSNVQTEFYRAVPGTDGWSFRSRSAASRCSRPPAGRPPSSATSSCRTWRLAPGLRGAARARRYASKSQMFATPKRGCATSSRIPAPGRTGRREQDHPRSLFGVAGVFYQTMQRLSVPAPRRAVLRLRPVREEQAALASSSPARFSSRTTPTRRSSGRRFDLGADVFGVAIPFAETNYRNGKEVMAEKIKHLPEFFQVNLGHPIGPYFKASLGLFTQLGQLPAGRGHGAELRDPGGHVDQRRGAAARRGTRTATT